MCLLISAQFFKEKVSKAMNWKLLFARVIGDTEKYTPIFDAYLSTYLDKDKNLIFIYYFENQIFLFSFSFFEV